MRSLTASSALTASPTSANIYTAGIVLVAAAMALRTRSRALSHVPRDDPVDDGSRAFLESVASEDAMSWVHATNKRTKDRLGEPKSDPRYNRMLAALDSKDKIPHAAKRGKEAYYNFWKDEKNPKGLWRRVKSLKELSDPKCTTWETVLDLDAVDKSEDNGKNSWVWKGYTPLEEPGKEDMELCLVKLSRAGADAVEIREFDVVRKRFIPVSEGGFWLPEAKSRVSWRNRDELIVGTDTGPGSMTDSGYPRTARVWKRGTALAAAPVAYEGQAADVAVSSWAETDNHGVYYEWRERALTFYTSEKWIKIGLDGEFKRIDVPEDVECAVFADQLLIQLRTDWTPGTGETFKGGSLIAVNVAKAGNLSKDKDAKFVTLFAPTATRSLEYYTGGKTVLLLSLMDNVRSELLAWEYSSAKGWHARDPKTGVPDIPGGELQKLDASSMDDRTSDLFWITASGFTSPTTLLVADLGPSTPPTPMIIRSLPAFWDATGVETSQKFAVSKDGTKIPYFIVSKKGNKDAPCICYFYGGFEVSLTPYYSAIRGIGWLEKGYTFVIGNIRGGGEFGPAWHQAALKEKRHKAYEDVEAVATDVVKQGIASGPHRLAVMGGSNGGLLVGNTFVRAPELWGAAVCEVPLLDMRRYSHLLAGASWMGEYGNPDKPKEWKGWLRSISPYHLLKSKSEVKYPPILLTTSTRDDRVHPGHARKFAHRLEDLGHGPTTFYYENVEGGHGGSANNEQTAYVESLVFGFCEKMLSGKPPGKL